MWWLLVCVAVIGYCIYYKQKYNIPWCIVGCKFRQFFRFRTWIPQGNVRDWWVLGKWFDIGHVLGAIIIGLLLGVFGLPIKWLMLVGLFLYFICWEGIAEAGTKDKVYPWEWGDLISDAIGFGVIYMFYLYHLILK